MTGQELYEIWVGATPKRSMERVWREVPEDLQEEWEDFAKHLSQKFVPYPSLEEWGHKVSSISALRRIARDIKTYDVGLSLRLLRTVRELCMHLKMRREAEQTGIEIEARERS